MTTSLPNAQSLGFGIRVIPGPKDSLTGGNNQLWFTTSAGGSEKRQFEILNPGDESANVDIEIVPAILKDGELVASTERDSVQTPWFKFSPVKFILNSNSNRIVNIEVSVPRDAEETRFTGFIYLNISGLNKGSIARKDEIVATARSIIRMRIPVMLTVGNKNDLIIDFDIVDLKDYSIAGKKYLNLMFKNQGTLPLGLDGEVSLKSIEFENLEYGPFEFGTQPIGESKEGSAVVELPTDFIVGKYRVFVTARQSTVEKNKVFDRNLQFPNVGDGSLSKVNLYIGVFIILILLAISTLLKKRLSKSQINSH